MSILKQLKTPVFAVEGILHLKQKNHLLSVEGLETGNRTLSFDELKTEISPRTINMRLTSVSGWSVRTDWDGILWRDFINYIRPAQESRYVILGSASKYTTCALLTDLAASTAMLVWGAAGEALEDEYGGPLRMVVPNLWGYKSCKWLTSISFSPEYKAGYWELRGYSHSGDIEPGETLDVNSQKYRTISGGEVKDF